MNPTHLNRNDTPIWMLRKYDVAAPRYTSNPAIPYWKETTHGEVGLWLEPGAIRPDVSLSL